MQGYGVPGARNTECPGSADLFLCLFFLDLLHEPLNARPDNLRHIFSFLGACNLEASMKILGNIYIEFDHTWHYKEVRQ